MAFNFDKAFEALEGIILNEVAGVFSGAGDPNGQEAPDGSIFINDSGELWQRSGSSQTEWQKFKGTNGVGSFDNTMFVALSGSDSTGTGSISNPFATLTGAYNAILNGDYPDAVDEQIGIFVMAGNFDQAPVDFSGFDSEIVILGFGPKTRINATNVNADLVTLGNNATVISCAFGGVTNASNYNLVWRTTNGGLGSAFNLRVETGSNSVAAFNDSGTFRLTLNSALLGPATGSLVQANDNTIVTLNSVVALGDGSTTIGVEQNGNSEVLLFSGRFTMCDTIIQVNGNDGNILISGISGPGSTRALDQNGTSTITILGGNFDVTSSSIIDTSKIEGYFFNELPEENQFRVVSELSVGLPNRGRETAMGEGDSYVTGMLVYTFNGSTYTNVSSAAASPVSSTITLPGTGVNNAFYISTAFDTSSPLKFYGIKVTQTVATVLGSGDLVFEYWDGSAWAEFNHMVTDSNAPHRPYANDKLTQAGSYQVYFDTELEQLWETNDPVSLGVNLHWIRVRVSSAITTAPVLEQVKIHTNRMEIEGNGFQTMYGLGRIKEKFPITFTGLEAVPGRGPQAQDVYLSDNIALGFTANKFDNRQQTQSSAFTQLLPFELDTSSPVTFSLSYFVTSNTAGNIDFRIRWATSQPGDGVYTGTGGAPTAAPNERSITEIIVIGSNEANTEKNFELKLEIPEAIAQGTEGQPLSKLWVVIERLGGDSYNGDLIVTDLAVFYTAWREGGYTGGFA